MFTLRATARIRQPDGKLSDLRRTVGALVKFYFPGNHRKEARRIRSGALVRPGMSATDRAKPKPTSVAGRGPAEPPHCRSGGAPWRSAPDFGIAIGERNLEAAIVRARPSGATLDRNDDHPDFRNRPAAEWGAELLQVCHRGGRDSSGGHGAAAPQ